MSRGPCENHPALSAHMPEAVVELLEELRRGAHGCPVCHSQLVGILTGAAADEALNFVRSHAREGKTGGVPEAFELVSQLLAMLRRHYAQQEKSPPA